MSRFKLEHLLPELVEDFRAVLRGSFSADVLPGIVAGLTIPQAWQVLNIVSRNRAYDDSHPFFVSNDWKRLLPFDGRKYCFYYVDGANDTHVRTLLQRTIKALQATP